jgi:hypothetical protein
MRCEISLEVFVRNPTILNTSLVIVDGGILIISQLLEIEGIVAAPGSITKMQNMNALPVKVNGCLNASGTLDIDEDVLNNISVGSFITLIEYECLDEDKFILYTNCTRLEYTDTSLRLWLDTCTNTSNNEKEDIFDTWKIVLIIISTSICIVVSAIMLFIFIDRILQCRNRRYELDTDMDNLKI